MALGGDTMLGTIIRKARKEAGLTQKQLGILCGYSEASAENTVQYWEYDKRDPPLEKLRILCKALGISLEQLIP